jgi:3-hydroxyacyl-CoA dehydrogenase / 3-hydroxy-2-methylbutyryl-CoA dehydrogenase
MSLIGKVALVTGGASGLGRATALRLARAGAKVAIIDLPHQPGGAVVDAIGASNSFFVPADVTSPVDVGKALDATFEKFGRLNAVVQCAGIATATKVLSKKGTHQLELFAKVGICWRWRAV